MDALKRDFYSEFKKLIEDCATDWEYEDNTDVLVELIEGCDFDHDVYVQLPGRMEDVLESVSDRRHSSGLW